MTHKFIFVIFGLQLFDIVRKERPTDLSKVLAIEGDITEPELAISANDSFMLSKTVNVVFHSAATVKFDEKLKLSVTINMLGTQRLVELCKRMTHLEALVSQTPSKNSLFLRWKITLEQTNKQTKFGSAYNCLLIVNSL